MISGEPSEYLDASEHRFECRPDHGELKDCVHA